MLVKKIPHAVDPEELKPIMYFAGLSLHACQQIEYSLKFLLFNMASAGIGSTTVEQAVAIIEDQDKRTLGQLLALLRQHVTIEERVAVSLASALEARNEVAHRFLVSNTQRIADPAQRPVVLNELKQLRNRILAGDGSVREIVNMVLAFRGIDIQELTKQFTEELSALNASKADV